MKGTLKLRTASLAAAAVMAAGLFAALPAAAETSTPETAQEDSGVPYDVANGLENSFRYKDGVPIYDDSVPAIEWEDIVQQDAATYSSNGIATCSVTYNGFDVSFHQGTVDWDAVKNSGIDFVMIRCGIGSEYDGVGENKQDDAQWYRNVSECERLGIPYGVYLYSYAENTDMAASEARHTLSLLSGHNPTLPVFLDIEHTRDGNPIASNSTYGDIAQTWCNMVSNAGYRVGIYSYYYFFQNYLTDSRFSNSGWYKWMADYRSGVSYDGSSCNMWQYSNKGTVPGVNANVDLNYWFGEYPGNNGGNNNNYTGWRSENGRDYWYENGVKQGTTGRGKEICRAAAGRPVMEFGARRAQGYDAAYFGARASYIGGCSSTSCVMAARDFGIPASGTMAHSWVQMFPTEYDAFKKYAEMYPDNCVLLVDTYNVLRHGVPDAIKVFDEVLKPMGKRPKGVRIDSGDIAYLSKKARQMLDAAGYPDCTVCASNSLDEYIVRDLILQGARVDSFGIGENMITAKSDPVFGGVYKLAAVKEDDGSYTPKMKLSESVEKMTIPCLKKVWRIYDEDGKAQADLITMADEVVDTKNGITLFDPIETWKECTYVNSTARCISTPIYENGKRVYTSPNLADIRKFCKAQVGTLWDEVKRFENPHRYYVDLSRNLWDTRSELLKKLSK